MKTPFLLENNKFSKKDYSIMAKISLNRQFVQCGEGEETPGIPTYKDSINS